MSYLGHMRNPFARFWEKVVPVGECMIWSGAKFRAGYGQFTCGGVHIGAHRWIYEQTVGPIPEGMHLDHLCRTPACVNVKHLEPVTPRENCLRGEHPKVKVFLSGLCEKGHRVADHPYRRKDGRLTCGTCRAADARRKYYRNRKVAA